MQIYAIIRGWEPEAEIHQTISSMTRHFVQISCENLRARIVHTHSRERKRQCVLRKRTFR